MNLLTDEAGIAEIIDFVRDNEVCLVILDTLARATAGYKESSFEDMSKAIAALDRIKEEGGAHVAVVHHAGYSRAGPRGSSDIVAAPDLIVEITREKGAKERQARIAENRHGKDGEVLRFTLESVAFDIKDSRGKPVVSAKVRLQGEWFEDLEAKEMKPPTDREREALGVLHRLHRDAAIIGPVTRQAWRDALERLTTDTWPKVEEGSESARRNAFNRAIASLEEKEMVKFGDNGLSEPMQ